MDETTAPAAVGQAADARPEGFSTVAAAVAEMDRRERERAAKTKAEKAAKADADDADDDDDEAAGRKPPKRVDGIDDEEKEAKPRKGKATEEESDDDEDDADGEGDGAADADDSGEAQDEDEPRKKPKADAEPPQKIKLRFEGREVEATPEHVQEYVEHASRMVREAQAEREQVTQARQQIVQQAQAMQQQAAALAQLAQHVIGAEPSLELAQTDPQSYLVQQGLFRQRQQVYQQLLQHAESAAGQAHGQQQQNTQRIAEAGMRALRQAMPELADPQKLAAFTGRALKVAQEYGFQTLQGVMHPGFYVMLRDLARLRDIEASRTDVRKKLSGAPPLKAPERRASAGPKDTQGLRSKDAKRAFMKSTRSMRDVRDYLDRTER